MEERAHVDETPMDVGQLQAQTCMHQNNDQEMEKHVYEEITLRMPGGEDGIRAEYGIQAKHGTRAGLPEPTKSQPLLGAECGPVSSLSPPKHQTSAEEPKEKVPLPPKPTGISTTLPALPIPMHSYQQVQVQPRHHQTQNPA